MGWKCKTLLMMWRVSLDAFVVGISRMWLNYNTMALTGRSTTNHSSSIYTPTLFYLSSPPTSSSTTLSPTPISNITSTMLPKSITLIYSKWPTITIKTKPNKTSSTHLTKISNPKLYLPITYHPLNLKFTPKTISNNQLILKIFNF